ncbi:MAG: hypothetical protein FJ137_07815 [Deltaproteobacteria bacterium]|nr:hypothetical protein [Deltaproteobacteria bacterium]
MIAPVALLLALAGNGAIVGARAAAASAPPASPAAAPPGLPAEATHAAHGFVVGHAALGGGVGLLALSTAAFLFGFEVERQLRQAPNDRGVVDALLVRRGIAAGVAWPAAALAAAGVVGGLTILSLDASEVGAEQP